MTAEIGLLNRDGVALAADSAVTIGDGKKIYNSANKLFSLSKFHPVGIMVFGGASFMGIPWETIIKVYREELGTKKFETLGDYAKSFVDFLKNNKYKEFSSVREQKIHILRFFEDLLSEKLNQLINHIQEYVNEKRDISNEDLEIMFKEDITGWIEEESKRLYESDYLGDFSGNDLKELHKEYSGFLRDIIQKYFENTPVDHNISDDLEMLCINSLLKDFSRNKSGLVIAGFGESELYPSLFSFYLDGKINNKIKIKEHEVAIITDDMDGAIIPFAQDEMVHTFIRGIDPDVQTFSLSYLENIFEQLPMKLIEEIEKVIEFDSSIGALKKGFKEVFNSIFEEYQSRMDEYQSNYYIKPIINIVQSLPKDELAEMAESLVNLTSFKRRVSNSLETVGGPIDVAVITKGDGFIWIKRKHYFDSNLNYSFFQNYLRSEKNELNDAKK